MAAKKPSGLNLIKSNAQRSARTAFKADLSTPDPSMEDGKVTRPAEADGAVATAPSVPAAEVIAETTPAPPSTPREPEKAEVVSLAVESTQKVEPSAGDAPTSGSQQTPARRVRRQRTSALTPAAAWEALEDSFKSAKLRPREWRSFTVRLPIALKERLESRLVEDQERTGNYKLAIAHYIDAALSRIPEDVDQAAQWGNDYLDERASDPAATTAGGTRLSTATADRMTRMAGRLRKHRYGLAGAVHAAAVKRLLDALDALEQE